MFIQPVQVAQGVFISGRCLIIAKFMVNFIKFTWGRTLRLFLLIIEVGGGPGMVDIMVARNYEYGDSGILYLFQFLCQLLVVYLLTILGDISAQDQDRRFFHHDLFQKSVGNHIEIRHHRPVVPFRISIQ